MYCNNCGTQNPEASAFCFKCGGALQPAAPPFQAQPYAVERKTSGFAISGLILGIISFFLGFLYLIFPILAIIFSGIGIGQTGKNHAVGGRGMAVAGLVCGIISLIGWILLFVFSVVYSINSSYLSV